MRATDDAGFLAVARVRSCWLPGGAGRAASCHNRCGNLDLADRASLIDDRMTTVCA